MNIPKELAKYDLSQPKAPKRRRLVMTSCGEKGTGKSDFMLRSAPKPLLHINLDRNCEHLEERYEGEDILFHHVVIKDIMPKEDPKDRQDEDFAQLMSIRDLLFTSMDKGLFRSYFVDTGDKFYDLAKKGFFGDRDFGEIPQSSYSKINSFFYKIFNKAKDTRSNFCMSHHLEDEWAEGLSKSGKKTGVRTGKRTMRCWKRVLEPSQCHVRFFKDMEESDVQRFCMEIVECNANPTLEGNVLRGEEIDFLKLGKLVYFPHAQDDAEWE